MNKEEELRWDRRQLEFYTEVARDRFSYSSPNICIYYCEATVKKENEKIIYEIQKKERSAESGLFVKIGEPVALDSIEEAIAFIQNHYKASMNKKEEKNELL